MSAGSNENISVACGLTYLLSVSCTLTFDQKPHQSWFVPSRPSLLLLYRNQTLPFRAVSFIALSVPGPLGSPRAGRPVSTGLQLTGKPLRNPLISLSTSVPPTHTHREETSPNAQSGHVFEGLRVLTMGRRKQLTRQQRRVRITATPAMSRPDEACACFTQFPVRYSDPGHHMSLN